MSNAEGKSPTPLTLIGRWFGCCFATEEELKDFYGPGRAAWEWVVLLCVVAVVVWTKPLQLFLTWFSTWRTCEIIGGLVALGGIAFVFAVALLEVIFRCLRGDYTFLEAAGLFLLVLFALPVVAFFGCGLASLAFFGVLWILGNISEHTPVAAFLVSLLIGGPILYVTLPRMVMGIRKLLIRRRAQARWDQDVKAMIGNAATGEQPVPITPSRFDEGGILVPDNDPQRQLNTKASDLPSSQPTIDLSGLPPGVVEVIRDLQATAYPSKRLRDMLAPIWSRLESAAARRNYDEITMLLDSIRRQFDAARDLRRSWGGIQRAEMEEQVAGLRVQVQLEQLQKKLAYERLSPAERNQERGKRAVDFEIETKLYATQRQFVLTKEIDAMKKQAQEIEDEDLRKKFLAQLDAIYETSKMYPGKTSDAASPPKA